VNVKGEVIVQDQITEEVRVPKYHVTGEARVALS